MAKTKKTKKANSGAFDYQEFLNESVLQADGDFTDLSPISGLDVDPSLYELTNLFYAYYQYHNNLCFVNYDGFAYNGQLKRVTAVPLTLSRYDGLRRVEACRLGSRPFHISDNVALHRPNVNMGYMRLSLDYLALPIRAVFLESDLVKIRINRKLYEKETLSEKELEVLSMEAHQNPNQYNNKTISSDTSAAFSECLRISKPFEKAIDPLPRRHMQDGVTAFLYPDTDWSCELIQALDLVTEPQCEWDVSKWSNFFVLRKMSAAEAVEHINNPEDFWNPVALRWALEAARDDKGMLLIGSRNQASLFTSSGISEGENFTVKSFYADKKERLTNIRGYYGNMLVVEGYYRNKDQKIDKVIFFPSNVFYNVPNSERLQRKKYLDGGYNDLTQDYRDGDVLFKRTNVYDSMEDVITVLPFDRTEPILERQRAFGHELLAPIEVVMRLDCGTINFASFIGTPFYKNLNKGTNAESMDDLEINVSGDMQDIGDREFVEVPNIQGDMEGLLGLKRLFLQHIAAKTFLGGLDGIETLENGRGADLAKLRLVKDARVFKHIVEDFAKGMKQVYTRLFKKALDLKKSTVVNNRVLEYLFFGTLEKVMGHPKELFEYDEADVLPDTGLPYWITLEAIRNGASSFGAAEIVLLQEVKAIFGDVLDQQALQAWVRSGLSSLIGTQEATDILGDPKDQKIMSQEQVHEAVLENAAILGSVDTTALNFVAVPVMSANDDHVLHLREIHNPKMKEIIDRLKANQTTAETLASMSLDALDSRTNLILKVGALANHASLHMQDLSRFGSRSPDINRLREETNALLQAAEGLMNSLQATLRATDEKRREEQLRLQNLSPENEAEKAKQQTELAKIQSQRETDKEKLMIANKIADQHQSQHIDKQLTAARDREAKLQIAKEQAITKKFDSSVKAFDVAQKSKERATAIQ